MEFVFNVYLFYEYSKVDEEADQVQADRELLHALVVCCYSFYDILLLFTLIETLSFASATLEEL